MKKVVVASRTWVAFVGVAAAALVSFVHVRDARA
jgi:hypothetical protein